MPIENLAWLAGGDRGPRADGATLSGGIPSENLAWLAGGGEMGALMRRIDWARTSLGSPETWSPTLRIVTGLLLANRFPKVLWWGPEFCQLYNDAYRPILGAKHPHSMGMPAHECWAEIWHVIGPLIETPFDGGPATWVEDLFLEINRNGFVEETHFTVAYSPVPDETAAGGIGGVLGTVHEITGKVVAERRVQLLRDVGMRAAEAKSAESACAMVAETLADHAKDVPFALLYLLDENQKTARLEGAVGIAMGLPASPRVAELGETASTDVAWPLGDVLRADAILIVKDIASRFGGAPTGPWSDAPTDAAIVPIRSTKLQEIAAFLIAGVSPRLRFDQLYRSFLELLATQIHMVITNARAHQEERRRAEALAEIDRAKTAFFSNVSHEFRTPLTLMMGPIEEILANSDARLTSDHRALLNVAHRNSLRLLRLVNTLLDFSRVEAGRVQASYEPVDLAALTADIVSNFRSASERAGLTLEVTGPPLGQTVYVDREMWEKIVLNLVSNAFKFTLTGGIEVVVAADGAYATLVVKDTGVGIPLAELPLVFERFHRVEGQRGRTHEGTGIGLALVQELVRLHRGEILVRSKVGEGTTFVVKIPFGRAHLPPERVQVARSLSPTAIRADAFVEEAIRWLPFAPATGLPDYFLDDDTPVSTDREAARVLVADDNADMREHLSHLLSKWWDVELVSDGQSALEAARRRKPDLILSDIMMPRLDGIGLIAALRAEPDLSNVPVILLSARAGEEARIEGLQVGADDYMVKPFSARELLARVRSNLLLSRQRAVELASMTRLHELSTRLTATSDLTSTLYEVLDATIEMQGADFGDVQLYDEATGTLKIVAHRGVDQDFLDYFATVDASETSACGLALRSGARIIMEDVNCHPDFACHRSIAASTGFRAVQSTPLFDRNSGKPLGMLSTHFREPHRPPVGQLRLTDLYARQAADVIAFRVAEQRVRESEARLSAIVAQFPGAVGLIDVEGRLQLRGGFLSGLWGDVIPSRNPKSRSRWRGFDANRGILPPASYPGARALRGEIVTPGVDFLYTTDEGRETWIRVSAAPFRSDAGAIIGAIATLQDVDDERRAQQRLQESEARLQAAVDLVKLAHYSWDPQTNELQWDDTLRAVWGLPPDMPEDYQVWRAGIHPDDLARVEKAVERCTDPAGDGVYDIEYRMIRKNDGVERWIATRGQTLFENGRAAWFYGVALDVSDRKELELNLERRVEERTLELEAANRQLRSQIEKREAAEAEVQQLQRLEAVGQITSGVAHDFNNLLTVVLANARLLSGRLRDPSDLEGAELIRTAAERGAKLTVQLLAFSRKQRLEPQEVDLNAKIIGMRELLGATLGGTIQLQTALARDLCLALVDPTHIELIILNLAINARDAMQAGGTLTPRDLQCGNRRWAFKPGGASPRQLCGAVRQRYRRRHPGRCASARLRTLLHHEGTRKGVGPRIVASLWLREAIRRRRSNRHAGRRGHLGEGLPASLRGYPRRSRRRIG